MRSKLCGRKLVFVHLLDINKYLFSHVFTIYGPNSLYLFVEKWDKCSKQTPSVTIFFFLLFHISKCFIFFKHTKIIINNRSSSCILHNFPTIKMIKLYIIKYYKLKTTRATKINKNNTKLTWIVIFIFYIIILRFNHNRYVNRDRRDLGKLFQTICE